MPEDRKDECARCASQVTRTQRESSVRKNRAINKACTFGCGLRAGSPLGHSCCAQQRIWDIGNGIAEKLQLIPALWFRYPISDIRHPRFSVRAFSRFLASYSERFFSRESTVVHTAFQRDLRSPSRWEHTHLARSPHWSTLAIHMNDNNLGGHSLLRPQTTGSTLRSPREMVRRRTKRSLRAPTPPRATSPLQPSDRAPRDCAAHLAAAGVNRARVGGILVRR